MQQNNQEILYCRICLEGQNLISCPCECKGSHQFLHEKCLTTWIEHQSSKARTLDPLYKIVQCELCKSPIIFSQKQKGKLSCISCEQVKKKMKKNICCNLVVIICLIIWESLFMFFVSRVEKDDVVGYVILISLIIMPSFCLVPMLCSILIYEKKYLKISIADNKKMNQEQFGSSVLLND